MAEWAVLSEGRKLDKKLNQYISKVYCPEDLFQQMHHIKKKTQIYFSQTI